METYFREPAPVTPVGQNDAVAGALGNFDMGPPTVARRAQNLRVQIPADRIVVNITTPVEDGSLDINLQVRHN